MDKFSIIADIEKARTLPSSFYRSRDIHELTKDKIFARTWHLVGDSTTLGPQVNAYPFILYPGFMDEPLVLTQDDQSKVFALSNVCTHRGNLVVGSPSRQKKLLCGYHGRRFNIDGSFDFMPEFEGAKDFPSECDNLPGVSYELWHQFHFVSLTPAYAFEDVVKVLNEKVGFLPISDFIHKPELSRDYLVNANWALYCDNYLEGFHIPFVHSDLNSAVDYGTYETHIYEHCNLQTAYSKGATVKFDLPPNHVDARKEVAAYYFWIFPNLMLNFYPWGLSVNIVMPLSKNMCKVKFLTYIYDETKMENSAGALLDKVEREDEFVVENVQKGLNSKMYKAGRFSPTKEKGVHYFHQLLARFLA